jgi:hypothetical protein
MPQYQVFWDEVVWYSVFVEAKDESEAKQRWHDPAYWDSEPEISGSDFNNNVEVCEV